ncbi:MAG: PD-(D/E)XK nuclease family protein, partial [Prevotellaceae bacterium]|nr:PD-(D/E)XK nuclease family protein [Prevotellaceae bacterium]
MTQENLKNEFEFINQFKQLHDKEKANLPYHINLIDELHADENAHSRILAKLLQYKSAEQKYDILDSFVEYLKEIGNRQDVDFNKIKIDNPEISQEKERIDLWIKEKNKYAIILENKVKS